MPFLALKLELALSPAVDNRFGLVVPEFVLTIRNDGTADVDVPETGLQQLRGASAQMQQKLVVCSVAGVPATW